jgi:hypothetical protein
MQTSSVSVFMQSSPPIFTTLSTVTVSSFSCKNIKKVDSKLGIADKKSNYNQLRRKKIITSQITSVGYTQKLKQLTLNTAKV